MTAPEPESLPCPYDGDPTQAGYGAIPGYTAENANALGQSNDPSSHTNLTVDVAGISSHEIILIYLFWFVHTHLKVLG